MMSSCLWWPPTTGLSRLLPGSQPREALTAQKLGARGAGVEETAATESAEAPECRGRVGDGEQCPEPPDAEFCAELPGVQASTRPAKSIEQCRGAQGTLLPLEVRQWRGYSAAEILRMRQALDLSNWEKGGELSRFAFLNASCFFRTAVLRRRGPVRALAHSFNSAIADFPVALKGLGKLPFDEYVEQAAIDGIIILHKGIIVYEKYPRMRWNDRHLLFSVGKVVVATLVAILEDRGQVSANHPIEWYLPELRSTAWEGVQIIDILDMASGIDAPEEVDGAYTDPAVKTYQFEASLGWLPKTGGLPKSVHNEETYRFLAELDRAEEPGRSQEYASVNTQVLAWLIERVTGGCFADALSEEIWGRIGAEADGLVTVNSHGIAAVHGGIISTLHDLARFGLLFTPSSRLVCREAIVSAAYLEKIRTGGRPELMPEEDRTHSGVMHSTYQWDQVWEDGSFFKSGFGNQGLYIHPDKDLVVAFFGTHGYGEEALPMPEDVCREMLCVLY